MCLKRLEIMCNGSRSKKEYGLSIRWFELDFSTSGTDGAVGFLFSGICLSFHLLVYKLFDSNSAVSEYSVLLFTRLAPSCTLRGHGDG